MNLPSVDVQARDAGPGGARPSAPTAVLIATCVSTLVVNANTSAVSILLPAISADTGTSLDVLQWAVTGYSLVGAAVIVTSGALGDVFGRRLVFLGGLALFIASCVLIALSRAEAGWSRAGRYIGAAAFTAAVATVNATVGASRRSEGDGAADALAAGLSSACVLLAIASGVGLLLSVLAVRTRRRRVGPGAYGAAAASHALTVPVESQ
ncbi:MFS transporter [Streptomyces sp. NPDC127077]|uniref:MFS transporter n=1 Tax=Streptomyces sp. NPDC127077 TaxID=3347131 RepID=UPI00365FA8FA